MPTFLDKVTQGHPNVRTLVLESAGVSHIPTLSPVLAARTGVREGVASRICLSLVRSPADTHCIAGTGLETGDREVPVLGSLAPAGVDQVHLGSTSVLLQRPRDVCKTRNVVTNPP